MSDEKFYELNVRKLGVDFYEFQERLAIFLENDADSADNHDEAKLIVLAQLKKEQLSKLANKKLL